MERRRYLAIAAAGVAVGTPGCLSLRPGTKYDQKTPLRRILPNDGTLEKYTLVSETEEGPNENRLKFLFRAFEPVEAAGSPVASRVTAGAAVARDAETAKTGLSDPVKDAIAGEENDVEWVSIEGYRVGKWVDRRQRPVFTLQDANLALSVTGTFDEELTDARWAHVRQYTAGALRRLDAAG